MTVSGILAFSIFGDSLLYSVLPLYAEELGVPLLMVGVVLSINRWVRLLSNPIAARTFRRYDLFLPLLVSALFAVISTAMYAFPLGVVSFIAARLMWGFCFSHFRHGGYLVVLRTSPSVLGLGMGVVQAVARVGSTFTVLVGGILIDRLGYQVGMLLLAGLSSLAIPLTFVLRRQLGHHSEQSRGTVQPSTEPIAPNRTFSALYCCVAGFVTHLVSNGLVVASLSLLLYQRVGPALTVGSITIGIATLAGAVFSTHWLSALLLSPLAGHLSDSLGRRAPFLAITAVQSVSLGVLALIPSAWVTVALAVAFFILSNLQKVLLDAALADSALGRNRGVIISRYNSAKDLGAAVGPLVGYGASAVFSFSQIYLVGAFAVAMLVIVHMVQSYGPAARTRG